MSVVPALNPNDLQPVRIVKDAGLLAGVFYSNLR